MDKQTYDLIEFLKNKTDQITMQEDGDIYCWIPFHELEEFSEIVGPGTFDDGGIEANLQNGCVFFIANDVLSYFGIDEEIFKYTKE